MKPHVFWAGILAATILVGLTVGCARTPVASPKPGRVVVLTFDDAVRSHLKFVAPLLREYGFGATFFVTARWMDDSENFLTWSEIAQMHAMGFEIGNHTWSHGGFNEPQTAGKLSEELARVERALAEVGVPRPVSFAWPGNGFGPESLAALREAGYRFARRGMQPEFPYGEIHLGPLYNPAHHDPLLIPTSADAYPQWTLEHFKRVVDRAGDGGIVVLQFHGVPDRAHPWVHTPPEAFAEYMRYLKDGGFRVVALRDVATWLDPAHPPDDPMTHERYPSPEHPANP